MQFHPTTLTDAWLIEPQSARDERGAFTRTFCTREFAAHGLETNFPQHSVSKTTKKGTVRGMHFQRDPHGEVKLVRCTRGMIFDVIVDVRPHSPTFCRWQAFELDEDGGHQLYVPKGFAHGYQTLTDDVEVSYLISAFYMPEAAAGFRHDDPAIQVRWPLPISLISDKDRSWPEFVT
jgi:dTDP-4-dehydrorhamnose 3,5-epimerase